MNTPALQTCIDRICAAAADGEALCIRGSGSKDFYGNACTGAVLETRALKGIIGHEPSELVITAWAGTPLVELEAALAEKKQCLPFEPPHFGPGATVGGMVAAGLSGPARASVGAVRDYVLGAALVNGRGQWLRFGGQVMKNVAGYDVSRVLAGSLGTLGLITEVSLKVLPLAPAEATLVFECAQHEALHRLNTWGGQPLPLHASSWLGEEGGAGVLHLRLRGAVAAVEAACRQLGGEHVDAMNAAVHWQACREQGLSFFTQRSSDPARDLWRLSLPQTAPALRLGGTVLIEWHGAQHWYRMAPGQAQRVRDAVRAAGGHATLFRAANEEDSVPRFDALSAPIARIHQALQREFDPQGIFNRGRLYADG